MDGALAASILAVLLAFAFFLIAAGVAFMKEY